MSDPIATLEHAAKDALATALGRVPETLRAGVTARRAEQGALHALTSLTNQIRLLEFLSEQTTTEKKP